MDLSSYRMRCAAAVVTAVFGWTWIIAPTLAAAQGQGESSTPAATPEAGLVEYSTVCTEAERDADANTSSGAYLVGGLFCGVIGWAIAAGSNPKAPADRLVGKDSQSVSIYTNCYEKRAKSKNTKAACTGWGVGAAISLAVWSIVVAGNSST